MLLLFVVVLAWVTGGRGTVLENRKCTKVNGVSGACDLKLNYFTLAGIQARVQLRVFAVGSVFLLVICKGRYWSVK